MTDVQAHRGLSAERPENTIAAFQAAADAGFPTIELDLRLTGDSQVVVLHDANITRTTDGFGRIEEMTLAEAQAFDTGEGPIPSLQQAFDALSSWNGRWNLEIKAEEATESTWSLVEEAGLTDRCFFTSMDPDVLAWVRQHTSASIGLITLGPPDEFDLDEARACDAHWLNMDHEFWTPEVHDKIRAAGLHVGAWAVNDPDEACRLAAAGVEAIITDTRDVLAALTP